MPIRFCFPASPETDENSALKMNDNGVGTLPHDCIMKIRRKALRHESLM